MLLKNKGQKIVHVGTVMLLPGESKDVADAVAASPAVTLLIGKGTLEKVGNGVPTAEPASGPKPDEDQSGESKPAGAKSGKDKPEKP